jgi:hypothetical protein
MAPSSPLLVCAGIPFSPVPASALGRAAAPRAIRGLAVGVSHAISVPTHMHCHRHRWRNGGPAEAHRSRPRRERCRRGDHGHGRGRQPDQHWRRQREPCRLAAVINNCSGRAWRVLREMAIIRSEINGKGYPLLRDPGEEQPGVYDTACDRGQHGSDENVQPGVNVEFGTKPAAVRRMDVTALGATASGRARVTARPVCVRSSIQDLGAEPATMASTRTSPPCVRTL